MEITSMNFEMYALDYAEGRLEGEALAAMEAYLRSHPGLREELALISTVALPAVPAAYPAKASLKQKREKIAWLPIAFAASLAASVVLALGVVWLALGSPEGELATTHTVQLPVSLADIALHSSQNVAHADIHTAPANALAEVERTPPLPASTVLVETLPDVTETPDEPIAVAGPVAVTVKLKTIHSYVLPVTLEFHGLEKEGLEAWEMETTALNIPVEKAARRSALRDGALSLLQERLMPSGISDLLSN